MSKEAMTLALEALEGSIAITMAKIDLRNKAIKALEEALAKQEQGKPVAWMSEEDECIFFDADKPNPMDYDFWTPLYTTPQPAQKPWVGLTDEDIRKADHHMVEGAYHYSFKQGAEWAEAKLKEKNT
jgi:hypothetical protein